jgi:hypothetical protein
MYVINVSWLGGPNWDDTIPSMFNPNKKKSAVEHLIETGGLSIDEAIENFDRFKKYPLKITQFKPESGDVNWITKFAVQENNTVRAEEIKNELVEIYSKKKQQLETESTSGYRIELSVDEINQ